MTSRSRHFAMLALTATLAFAWLPPAAGIGCNQPVSTTAAEINAIDGLACNVGETVVALAQPDGGAAGVAIDTGCALATSPAGAAIVGALAQGIADGSVRLRKGHKVQAVPAPTVGAPAPTGSADVLH